MKEGRAGWLFLAPALVVLGVFFFLPVGAAFVLSFTDWDIYALANPADARFVGFKNYLELFRNRLFWKALGNTVYFALAGGALSIGVALGAALLLHSKLVRWKTVFRTALFSPVVTTMVAVAVVWKYLLHTRYGFINYLLGLVGIGPVDWLGDPAWSIPAILLLATWKNFGYNMILFLAGLQAIPQELYEAARIDGASAWSEFRHVTLPMLRPTFVFVGVLTLVGYFQLFAEPYVMTQGGPVQSTVSIVYLLYDEGFKWWNMGFASAVAFVLLALILVVTRLQFRREEVR